MLKRIIASALVFVLLATALVSCGGAKDITPDVAEGTVGYTIWTAFKTQLEATPDASMDEILNTVFAFDEETGESITPYFIMTMPIETEYMVDEEGKLYLMGLDGEFTADFESCTMFAPMIGVVPFMGYVFELAENADVAAFVETIKGQANLNWNICTWADQLVIGTIGNKVFFLMCPESFEENPDDGMGGMDL